MARILVVEDDADNRIMLCELLKSWGYDCDAAESGEAAMDLVQSQCPDVIISDLAMPGMTGLDLLQAIRASNRDCQQAAFFLLTGHATVTVGVNAIELGADECLTKPLQIDSFRAMLETRGFYGGVNHGR